MRRLQGLALIGLVPLLLAASSDAQDLHLDEGRGYFTAPALDVIVEDAWRWHSRHPHGFSGTARA